MEIDLHDLRIVPTVRKGQIGRIGEDFAGLQSCWRQGSRRKDGTDEIVAGRAVVQKVASGGGIVGGEARGSELAVCEKR